MEPAPAIISRHVPVLLWRPPKASMHMPTHRQEHATQTRQLQRRRCWVASPRRRCHCHRLCHAVLQKRFSLGVIARIVCSSALQDRRPRQVLGLGAVRQPGGLKPPATCMRWRCGNSIFELKDRSQHFTGKFYPCRWQGAASAAPCVRGSRHTHGNADVISVHICTWHQSVGWISIADVVGVKHNRRHAPGCAELCIAKLQGANTMTRDPTMHRSCERQCSAFTKHSSACCCTSEGRQVRSQYLLHG